MNCILGEKIDHSNFKEKFKDTLFFCRLFENEQIGMNQLGIVCGACCIRCQMIGEILAELIMKGAITYEDLERDPNCLLQYLSEELTKYGEVVSELSGKDWESIRGICNRCNPLPVKPVEVPKVPATKMTNIAKHEV
jgi:hypothetical protein